MTAKVYILTSRPRVPAAKLEPLYPLQPIYWLAFEDSQSSNQNWLAFERQPEEPTNATSSDPSPSPSPS